MNDINYYKLLHINKLQYYYVTKNVDVKKIITYHS